EAYHGANAVRGDLQEEEETVSQIRAEITSRLQRLTGQSIAENNWSKAINRLNGLRDELQQEVNRHNVALATLGVSADDYHVEPAPVDYSQKTLQSLLSDLEQAEAELQAKTDELRTLKQRVSEKTGDEITLDWETLIHNLQRKRQEIAAEYRAVTAQIVAGVLVNGQLEAIREQEEEKIREKLGSDVVCGPVFDITRRYSGIAYEDGSVFVSDNYGRFPLADLSTGAREQVLLGLRIGFAAHLLRQSRLFLLLDDAFQHADWQRRRWLLDQVVALAKDGWQIVYFTMDDHIRDLFHTAGQTHFPENYCYHDLGG
ncbi:MAG: ATP-binding protein, partial [Chloroflexota bacterium]